MPCVVGIDQSARSTGICVINCSGDLLNLSLLVPPEKFKEGARLKYIRDSLTQILLSQKDKITLGVMEGYSYNSVSKKFILGEVGGIIKLLAMDLEFPLYIAAPKQLKKFVTGNHAASKPDVARMIESKWSVKIDQYDKADAYGLARIGLQVHTSTTTNRKEL